MNRYAYAACSGLLAFTSLAFAEGFYFQGGGGAGFMNGSIAEAGSRSSETTPFVRTPVIDDSISVTGSWFVGLGYMFTSYFGLEADYYGFPNQNATKNQVEDNHEHKYEMSTELYDITLLGVARTPFEVGFGFFVKAKAGLAYTDQTQNIKAYDSSGIVTFLDTNQNERKFSPALGIGIENDVTDLVSISLEYLAISNNDIDNSTVFLAVKFNPFDVMDALGY